MMKKIKIPGVKSRKLTQRALPLPLEIDLAIEHLPQDPWSALPFRLAPPPSPVDNSKQKPVYSVVIINQNAQIDQRGKDFSKFLMHELGDSILWTTDAWNMDQLNLPDIRRAATEAAAIADVVILSLDGHAELPDGVKAWLEEWAGRLFGWSPILIALFSGSDKKPSARATQEFLGTIADACGLTFLHTSGKSSIVEYRPPIHDCLGLIG